MANKITVTSAGTTANVNATPDSARYYSDKSKEWAISDKLIDNEDYSSKYYANESKKQADISTAKTTEVIESGNNAVSNIESARDNAITNIINRENVSVENVNSAGTTQINLAKEQVILATNQANIAKEQATIATSQASIATSKTTEVVESGNTALSNIETAKSNALNDINTTGAEYVNNAEQYAQSALNSSNNAKTSENNALSYKNSAQESSQTATEQASIATTSANKAITSANNAKTSETNAKSSETRCEEILSRLGTAIKVKGRVDSLADLPSSGNLDGDTYLVGEEGLDSYPEYYWYQDHWEFLGTSGTSLSWGLISGNIAAQTDLQTALDSKQNKGDYALKSEIPTKISQLTNDSGFINNDSTFVHKTGNETVAGVKTFSSNPIITGTGININNSNDVVIQKQGTNFLRKASNGGVVLSGTNTIYIRPSGDTNTTGQLSVAKDGTVTGTKFVGSLKGNVTGNVSGSSGSCTGNSATATKATQDGNGNNIVNTYATKTSLNAKANTSLSNLTDAGKKVIKDNSGGWNPPLLSTMWSDHLLNDMSWLRADTFSWQDGTTYSSAYNELLSEYNNSASTTKTEGNITFKRTPKGYKIALANQETAILNKYNSDGIAWYYILDTANKKFKLPRAKHPSLVNSTSTAPVVGNGNSLGFTTGSKNFGLLETANQAVNNVFANRAAFNVPVGKFTPTSWDGEIDQALGVTTDHTKSGLVADLSKNVKDYNMYLYFYVGNFTKSAEAQTAGLKAELLNGKADVTTPSIQAPYLKDTYVNGTSGYRIWSDGYCEQWGLTSKIADFGTATVNLLKSFKNLNYAITKATMMPSSGDDASYNDATCIRYATRTESSFQIYNRGATDGGRFVNWHACGYIS